MDEEVKPEAPLISFSQALERKKEEERETEARKARGEYDFGSALERKKKNDKRLEEERRNANSNIIRRVRTGQFNDRRW